MASTFILTDLGIKRAPRDELDLQYNLHTLVSLRSIAYQHITRPLCSPSLVSPVVTSSSATIISRRDCCLTFLRKLVRPRFCLKILRCTCYTSYNRRAAVMHAMDQLHVPRCYSSTCYAFP